MNKGESGGHDFRAGISFNASGNIYAAMGSLCQGRFESLEDSINLLSWVQGRRRYTAKKR